MRKYKMTKTYHQDEKEVLITGLINILLGIVFIVFRSTIFSWIGLVLGIIMIVYGIIDLVRYHDKHLLSNIFIIVCGVLFATTGFFSNVIISIIFILFGIYLIYNGAITLQVGLKLPNSKIKWLHLIHSLLTIVFGVLMIISGFKVADIIFIMLGVFAVLNGCSILLNKKSMI